MENFGSSFSGASSGFGIVYLRGRLGAGKTTLCRGMLRGMGFNGAVKSPTFTLVEPYDIPGKGKAFHFDLYRLADPEEFELMGGRDYFEENSLFLIEWPEKGEGWLPKPDIDIQIEYARDRRYLNMISYSEHGDHILTFLGDHNLNV